MVPMGRRCNNSSVSNSRSASFMSNQMSSEVTQNGPVISRPRTIMAAMNRCFAFMADIPRKVPGRDPEMTRPDFGRIFALTADVAQAAPSSSLTRTTRSLVEKGLVT